MALSVTNTFTAGTTAVASQVNTNFSDVTTYVNTNAVLKDATLAFTQVPSGPATDPSSANHLTRKLWVDRNVGSAAKQESDGTFGPISAFDTYYNVASMDVTVPNGKNVIVDATGQFLALDHNGHTGFWSQMAISADGGVGWTYGAQLGTAAEASTPAGGSPRQILQITPTTTFVRIVLRVQQRASVSSLARIYEPTIFATITPSTALTL